MFIDEIAERLVRAARTVGWEASEQPLFVSRKFRGRTDESEALLPSNALGVRLGVYPVIIGELSFGSVEQPHNDLRALHNQMLIARSYLPADAVVDAHIFLVCAPAGEGFDWARTVDLIERNEIVCRKLVWVRDPNQVDKSFDEFLGRTFLARPWQFIDSWTSAPLDQNEQLVENVLIKHGLSPEAAAAWVTIADAGNDDTNAFVDALVAAVE